jgi:UDPglucose--hexose-1-phosphate uridylyltransferase
MNELRWHPLLRQWVVVSTHRQDRPQLPKDWCPFCPGSGRVPEDYEVYLYPNDFPGFHLDSPPFEPHPDTAIVGESVFQTTGPRGACDVVLYSKEHNRLPSELPARRWRKVIDLWTRRTRELAAIPEIQYVYVFENTGLAIGVTMPHPHGQIYAFPFLPPLAKAELDSAAEYHSRTCECLYCRILCDELKAGQRIVAQNEDFVAFCPFFSRWPSEVQIYARRHMGGLEDLTDADADSLGALIKTVRQKYDHLYGFPLPLMMIVRQRPAKGDHPYFHFHVEFLPIQRSKTKLKYLAAVESGNGTFLNDTLAEEQAGILRNTEPR